MSTKSLLKGFSMTEYLLNLASEAIQRRAAREMACFVQADFVGNAQNASVTKASASLVNYGFLPQANCWWSCALNYTHFMLLSLSDQLDSTYYSPCTPMLLSPWMCIIYKIISFAH